MAKTGKRLTKAYDGIDPTVLGSHDQVYVYNEMHGGWLFRFPDDFVAALARLNGGDLAQVGEDWSKIFASDGSPPSRRGGRRSARAGPGLAAAGPITLTLCRRPLTSTL